MSLIKTIYLMRIEVEVKICLVLIASEEGN